MELFEGIRRDHRKEGLSIRALAWPPTDHARVADTIEAALPLMTAVGVEELVVFDDECEYVRYDGGEYLSGSLAPGVCHDRQVPGSHEIAADHVAAIRQALGRNVARDFAAFLVYGDDGSLLRARFMTGPCTEYRYEPIDTFPFGPGEVMVLRDDWWVITQDHCSSSD